jgi:hypothetical protein
MYNDEQISVMGWVDPFEDASHDPAMRVVKKKKVSYSIGWMYMR